MQPVTNYLKEILGKNEAARDTIKNLPMFRECTEALIEKIYEYGKISQLRKGETLIQEGDFDQWVHIILHGSLSVFVNDQKIDVINKGLIGERCILGEPRKATLKAEENDTSSFGIDMAVLDVLLKDGKNEKKGEPDLILELLLLINGLVIERVFFLWYHQLKTRRFLSHQLKHEAINLIIDELSGRELFEDPVINEILQKFIQEYFSDNVAHFIESSSQNVKTALLCSTLNKTNRYDLLYEISGKIYNFVKKNNIKLQGIHLTQIIDFGEVSKGLMEVFSEKLGSNFSDFSEKWDNKYLVFSSSGKLFFTSELVHDLKNNFQISRNDLIELFNTLLEKSLEFNAIINKSVRENSELTQKLTAVPSQYIELDIKNIQKNQEIMLNANEYLITPYIKALKEKSGSLTPPEITPIPQKEKENSSKYQSQADIDALFD